MAMSKGKVVAGAAGGVFAVAALALAYLVYDAASACGEAEDSREEGWAAFRQYNAAKVFPSKKSIQGVTSNATMYARWRTVAGNLAARGDRAKPADESPAAFKQRLTAEVHRLAALPGGVAGRLVAPTFLFGFDQYLGESAVLPETGDVPRLSVQLAAIAHFAEIFAEAGVLEVRAVKRLEKQAPAGEETSRRNNRKKAGAAEAEEDAVTSFDYAVTVAVRPAGFVNMLNALTADVRFTVVRDLAFHSSEDVIVNRITAVEQAKLKRMQGEGASSRRRRRRAAAAEEAAVARTEQTADDRLVADPEIDAPIVVDMTLSVYDFGQAAAPAAAAEKEAK